MRASWMLPLVSIFCVFCLSASGQQTASTSSSTAASDPQAVALIQKAVTALTGSATIADVTLTGTAERIAGSDDETGTATLKATSLGDSRVELDFPSGKRTEIRNHSTVPLPGSIPAAVPVALRQSAQPAGAWWGPDGVVHGIVSHNLWTDPTWFFPAFTLGGLLVSEHTVFSYVGEETLQGEPVVHIVAAQLLPSPSTLPATLATLGQHLSRVDIYVNSTTLLPFELSFNTHPDTNALVDIPTEIRFATYRLINGVQIPFSVQEYINNGLVLSFQLDSANLNTGLDLSAFGIH